MSPLNYRPPLCTLLLGASREKAASGEVSCCPQFEKAQVFDRDLRCLDLRDSRREKLRVRRKRKKERNEIEGKIVKK